MKQTNDQSIQDLETRYQNALNEDVSTQQMQQFRHVFEEAWMKRSLWSRIFGKPLHAGILAVILVLAGLGSGYGLMSHQTNSSPSIFPNPILMPGQRIVEDPELMGLFPKVNQPTLISSQLPQKPDQAKYMVHGYLEDDIQIVWEY